MFPSSPAPSVDGRDRDSEGILSRTTSIQSRGTNLATFFDTGDPVQGRVLLQPTSPGFLNAAPTNPSRSNTPVPYPPRDESQGPFLQSFAQGHNLKESDVASRNAVENNGDDTFEGVEGEGAVSRLSSCKAEIVDPNSQDFRTQ